MTTAFNVPAACNLPNFEVSLKGLDSLAVLLHFLRDARSRGRLVILPADCNPELRGSMEWLAARGLVEFVRPSWTHMPKPLPKPGESRAVAFSLVSWDLHLTDRGIGLANLLPQVRP